MKQLLYDVRRFKRETYKVLTYINYLITIDTNRILYNAINVKKKKKH